MPELVNETSMRKYAVEICIQFLSFAVVGINQFVPEIKSGVVGCSGSIDGEASLPFYIKKLDEQPQRGAR